MQKDRRKKEEEAQLGGEEESGGEKQEKDGEGEEWRTNKHTHQIHYNTHSNIAHEFSLSCSLQALRL